MTGATAVRFSDSSAPTDVVVAAEPGEGWADVCSTDRLRPGRGVCALVDGVQVALFRTPVGGLHAVANCDPFSGANVMSRGIVGSVGDRCVVASPMYKQRFDLATGECIDDPTPRLAVHAVVERAGRLFVRLCGQSRETSHTT